MRKEEMVFLGMARKEKPKDDKDDPLKKQE